VEVEGEIRGVGDGAHGFEKRLFNEVTVGKKDDKGRKCSLL